ncbi:Fc.00g022180.m01.CDS01 [Cosmosporella sp. VM-42]
MRFDFAILALSVFSSAAASVIDGHRNVARFEAEPRSDEHDLYKRRGGGGGGGKGGGGGSGSGGKSGGGNSGGGKSGGSKGSKGSKSTNKGSSGSGGSGGSSGNSRSNSGGSSSKGSGPQPNFVGGRYYGGGAATPYRAGGRSASGILPFVLVGSLLAFWPGVWLYGAYMYPYHNQYRYHNDTSDEDESRPIICGCAQYSVCGCDENNNTDYYNELIGTGDYSKLNKSLVNVADVNGTTTILINGTLPNGTTVQSDDSAAGDSMRTMLQALGFWPAIAAVIATVFLV